MILSYKDYVKGLIRSRILENGIRDNKFSNKKYGHDSLSNERQLIDKLILLITRVIFSETVNINPGVSVITCTNRINSLGNILNNYLSQKYPIKELIIVINNNSISLSKWKEEVKFISDIRIFKKDEKYSLGECLNFAIERANYPHISKFDDDDYYGPYYLTDTLNVFKYTDASIVGKYTAYAYMEGRNELVLRFPGNENRYIDSVLGSTLTFKKEISENVKFRRIPKGSDTVFLRACLLLGYKIYSTDRFNHVVHRRRNLNTHSWKISEKEFLKNCILIKKTKDYNAEVTI